VVGHHVERGDDDVGRRVGRPEIAHRDVADVLFEGSFNRLVGVAVARERKQARAPGLAEDRPGQFAVQPVHLGTGQSRADAGRDDRAGRGTGCQPEDVVRRLAQVVLQDGQRTGDDHALDAAAVNGDGDVVAEWSHGVFSFRRMANSEWTNGEWRMDERRKIRARTMPRPATSAGVR